MTRCSVRRQRCILGQSTHTAMITTTFLLIWKLLLPLLVMVALIDWLTASDDRRIRILRSTGLSQRAIANRLNITRYRVRQALAS